MVGGAALSRKTSSPAASRPLNGGTVWTYTSTQPPQPPPATGRWLGLGPGEERCGRGKDGHSFGRQARTSARSRAPAVQKAGFGGLRAITERAAGRPAE